MRNRFDLRGTIPPFSLLKLTHRLRKLRSGETMEVIGSSPDSEKDVLNVLTALPCEVFHVGNTGSGYFIRLRKLAESKAHKQCDKNEGKPLLTISRRCPDSKEDR